MSETPTPSPEQTDIVQVIIAIFIPPLAVYLKEGSIGQNFWINLVLTFLGGLPGVAHALWLILLKK